LSNLTIIENKPGADITGEAFAEKYFQLRKKEGRIYTDDEVLDLPLIDSSHPHHKEWAIRKNSARALLSYIKQRGNILSILEVGCGNGWLSAKLSGLADTTGLDINTPELDQAKRIFGNISNLRFIHGDLENDLLRDEKFDMIVFASSIQYFSSIKQTIGLAVEHLTMLGEVHIMDSPFYKPSEIDAARERTKVYYGWAGFEEMASCYHHHTINELESFQFKILHHPHSWKNKLSIKKNPFYWITIKNRYS
jgi:ubiquinone/menaquinone biosynthesis C-methylase UbiE